MATWTRLAGSNYKFHMPNQYGRRAYCSYLLPPEHKRETDLDPLLEERCETCSRDYERREHSTEKLVHDRESIIRAKRSLEKKEKL